MAGVWCFRCGSPQTRARVVIDGRSICGDCFFRQTHREPDYRRPTLLEEAVESVERLALFSSEVYRR